ncbi:Transposase (putative), gypsy type [Corchorus olitorius]|uniref:Transposase (Putative), gypsy type n=1 Tax=Corchorus olitorius TaxID=93759 RepID=A0A1R3HU99_9ROSI|nr:Transposase (putative), gypsy type [Corchorus olitorius]
MSESGESDPSRDEIASVRGSLVEEGCSAMDDVDEEMVDCGAEDSEELSSDTSGGSDYSLELVGASRPVHLNFDVAPNILKEHLRVYHKYCRVKFGDCSARVSRFQLEAHLKSTFEFYRCASEVGLCDGKNGFEALVTTESDRAFHIRDLGKVCFFYRLAFDFGFRLPVHPFIVEVCRYYGVALTQFVPNTWKILISYIVVCVYKGWTPHVSVIRFLFQIQRRIGGWYAFQVRRGKTNKFPGPGNNHKWQRDFFGVEIKEGAEWGIAVQWWEINSSKKNYLSDLILSDEEETHVDYLQRVRHTPEQLCHRTRLYLCGIGPPPDSYNDVEMEIIGPLAIDGVRMVVNARGEEGRKLMMGWSEDACVDYVVYNLINGRLELDPNTAAPEASPELFGEELDPELPMDKDKVSWKDAIRAGMNRKKVEPQDKAQGKKRPAEQPPKDNMPKKSRAAHEVRSAAPESVVGVSSSKPSGVAGTSSSSSKVTSVKDTPSRGERPLVGREGSNTKHSAVPPRGRGRGNLDFLCDLMAQLKMGDPREIATVEDFEDDECVACLAALANKVAIFSQRLLLSYRPSLTKKDKGLLERLDDNCLLMNRKECREIQSKADKDEKARKDVERLHGSLEKKFAELEAKFSKLERDHSDLTGDYASLKKSKDENASTFGLCKIQMQKEIEDLKALLDEKVAECEKKDAEIADIVAQASGIASDLADGARGGDIAIGGKISEVAEALACDVLILPSELEFTTNDLLRVAQDELARNDDIADEIFADDVVVASASVDLSALLSRVGDVGAR